MQGALGAGKQRHGIQQGEGEWAGLKDNWVMPESGRGMSELEMMASWRREREQDMLEH